MSHFQDKAIARFECSLCPTRLLVTTQEEVDRALDREARYSQTGLSTVYVIDNDANGFVKIGYADNLKQRFCGLKGGSPVALRLRHFLHVVDSVVATRVESETHKKLAGHRKHGEWFDVSVETASRAIADVMIENRLRWWSEDEKRTLGKDVRHQHERMVRRQSFFG